MKKKRSRKVITDEVLYQQAVDKENNEAAAQDAQRQYDNYPTPHNSREAAEILGTPTLGQLLDRYERLF